ncbi:MAG: O-antigen ligase family protein [Bacilli bacterium]|nr:O-antigen ligase family protein [Bacilli bacterium]
MNDFIKKNISIIIAIFVLLGPILDLITGLCLHTLGINLTLGIIVRVLFLVFICIITLFTFKKKNVLIPYLIIGLYFILYTIGMLVFKDTNLFTEIQNLVKVFYFPILLVSIYSIKDEIRISNLTLFTVMFTYLILIFIPTLLNLGYDTYEIAKVGTLGFFNSANEISGIISLLTPTMLIVLFSSKNIIPKLVLALIYIVVILMVGTKTPILALGITIGISVLYLWIKSIKAKKYKNVFISLFAVIILGISLILVIPKTNFYKNIKIHLDYLELDSITEVFTDKELVDHFIFSSRLKFLDNKAALYNKSNTYLKIFGIGYLKNYKATKMIEMDYFDILFSHGIVGFIIFFGITVPILVKIVREKRKVDYEYVMNFTSLLLIIILAFFTGHIITAPSVSLLSIILLLTLNTPKKKNLLFASKNLDLGGIEKASINLLNRIDYSKFNVTLVLEEKKGTFLPKLNKNVRVEEVKVSDNKNVILRKLINAYRKLVFKVLNYHTYDFSCCYTTYSYSCNKIAKIASRNNSIYVHSDYKHLYKDINEYRQFFDSRKVNEYKYIIFVSNEAKDGFIEEYKELEEKCLVFNNFVDTKEIIELSNGVPDKEKDKDKTLFVFVGRLDDSSKKVKRAINLVKNIKELELWIIGDGPDREMYEKYTKELKVEKKVSFLGKKINPYPYMKQADYIILTSDYEGFPVTYLEAITLDKKIITTIPTSDEYINIKDYAYIISKDENKMVEEVKEILAKKKSKSKIDLAEVQEKRIKKLEGIFTKN